MMWEGHCKAHNCGRISAVKQYWRSGSILARPISRTTFKHKLSKNQESTKSIKYDEVRLSEKAIKRSSFISRYCTSGFISLGLTTLLVYFFNISHKTHLIKSCPMSSPVGDLYSTGRIYVATVRTNMVSWCRISKVDVTCWIQCWKWSLLRWKAQHIPVIYQSINAHNDEHNGLKLTVQ